MDVTVLSLVNGPTGCGTRTPVLACVDALKAAGARVELAEADDDAGIDTVVTGDARIVVAADTDAQVRAVLRRAVRCLAPPPSSRPDDLPGDRTVPDLPPLAILPLAQTPDLVAALKLPDTPEAVAAAVIGGAVKRTDLLRNDAGGVTVHGVRVGGGDTPWRGKIALDDAILTAGQEALVTCVVANADGYGEVDGLPLSQPDPCDGKLDVAVAVPFVHRGLFKRRTRVEVRRAAGRAVEITPVDPVPFVDDGVVGELRRKRTWWMERAAAGWYVDAPA
ncbi:hypothetical protein [Stackebrandtia nassauensis]|uniref:DAGKc domain-containing protein n=1 Tax=Stackebrandtia nassauensis (strain DSM 44728 / CIP 108903 / NRRL B-16338 / NBRC 102104 / LLR-40K-21) TaxID=446470 RepID=D3Q075_STANL|nr:hypothetical protein [Stackebrandtia nassauensis]ADD45604.1 hypothetical protein Snas_5978 [Stackebrandtia nassauensis DSM 44728]